VYFTKWLSGTSKRIVMALKAGLPHHGQRARPLAWAR
jgi:hypothetical protein